jgi:hypothetical protein
MALKMNPLHFCRRNLVPQYEVNVSDIGEEFVPLSDSLSDTLSPKDYLIEEAPFEEQDEISHGEQCEDSYKDRVQSPSRLCMPKLTGLRRSAKREFEYFGE